VKDLARDQQAIHKQLQGALSIKDPRPTSAWPAARAWPTRRSRPSKACSRCWPRARPRPHAARDALKTALAKARTALKDAMGKAMDES
jgi:hypothetical protein